MFEMCGIEGGVISVTGARTMFLIVRRRSFDFRIFFLLYKVRCLVDVICRYYVLEHFCELALNCNLIMK